MECQACSYEYVANQSPGPFLKLEFDVSMKGKELPNKNHGSHMDNGQGPRNHFVTLYACPKCGTVRKEEKN